MYRDTYLVITFNNYYRIRLVVIALNTYDKILVIPFSHFGAHFRLVTSEPYNYMNYPLVHCVHRSDCFCYDRTQRRWDDVTTHRRPVSTQCRMALLTTLVGFRLNFRIIRNLSWFILVTSLSCTTQYEVVLRKLHVARVRRSCANVVMRTELISDRSSNILLHLEKFHATTYILFIILLIEMSPILSNYIEQYFC